MSEGHGGTRVTLFVIISLIIGILFKVVEQFLPFSLPYTAILFLVGWGWGALMDAGELSAASDLVVDIGPGLLLFAFLPALVFFSAFETKWFMLRRSLGQIVLLAVVGLAIVTVLGACAVKGVLEPDWDWPRALLMAAILSATDPVAVVALMRANAAPDQIITLMEGESLLNDGFAMVAFLLCLKLVEGETLTAGGIVGMLLQLSVGGTLLGLVWAAAVIALLGRVRSNSTVEPLLLLTMSFLLFYVAEEQCQVSAVLSVVMYGISFPWYGKARISPGTIHDTETFLANMAFMSETVIFVLCGAIIAHATRQTDLTAADWGNAIALWFFEIIIRGLMLAVLSPLLHRSGDGFGKKRALIMTWGGLRGAVSLALALDVKVSSMDKDFDENVMTEEEFKADEDYGNRVLFYTSVVVILTLVINAPLTGPLLQWLSKQQKYRLDEWQVQQDNEALDDLIGTTDGVLSTMKGQVLHKGTQWDKVKSWCTSHLVAAKAPQPPHDTSRTPEEEKKGALVRGRIGFLAVVREDLERQNDQGMLRWAASSNLLHLNDEMQENVLEAAGTSFRRMPKWAGVEEVSLTTAGGLSVSRHSSYQNGGDDDDDDRAALGVGGDDDAGGGGASPVAPGRGASDARSQPPTSAVVNRLTQPAWLGWLQKQRHKVTWPATWLIDTVAEAQLLDTISALDGLVHAFEAASERLRNSPGAGGVASEAAGGAASQRESEIQREVRAQILAEASGTVQAALHKLAKDERKYPHQFKQIRSSAAAAHVLTAQKHRLHDERAQFSARLYARIEETIDAQQNSLRCDRMVFMTAAEEALAYAAPPEPVSDA